MTLTLVNRIPYLSVRVGLESIDRFADDSTEYTQFLFRVRDVEVRRYIVRKYHLVGRPEFHLGYFGVAWWADSKIIPGMDSFDV